MHNFFAHRRAFIVCALIFFLGTAELFAGSLFADDTADEQRTLIIVDNVFDYDLNPHTAAYNSEAQILCGLYEGLFSYDPVTLEPLPALCESYKISRDKKRWTFTLIENATFSDGSPITAETFRRSWMNLLATEKAPFASLIDCIAGAEEYRSGKAGSEAVKIEARNDRTLVVHLKQSTEHFARILCHHAFSAVSPSGIQEEGIFSGAFKLKSFEGTKLELEKNEKYHDAESVKIPGITILQSDDEEENSYLFNTGNADWLCSSVSAKKILNNNSIHISAEFGTSFLFFKLGNEPWNNSLFRAALLEAIPYEKFRGAYSIQAQTLVYPLAGYPNVNGINDYDLDYAKELMLEARKEAGIPEDEEIILVFACTDSEYMREQAELLGEAWKELGVKLVPQTTTFDRYNSSIPYWNADLFTYSWIGDFADPLAFLELFRGGSSLNLSNYTNSEFDALLNAASETSTAEDHMKILAKAEQLLLDDSMIIPVYHPITMHIIDTTKIGGWQTNALDLHPFKYLYFKKTKSTVPNIVLLTSESLLSSR